MGTLKLAEAEKLAPAPDGVGTWAAKLRAATEAAVTEADLTEMVRAISEKAKKGDLAAAKWLVDFLTPKPPPAPKVLVKRVVVGRKGRRPREGRVVAGGDDDPAEDATSAERIAREQRLAVGEVLAKLGPTATAQAISDEVVLPLAIVRKRLEELRRGTPR